VAVNLPRMRGASEIVAVIPFRNRHLVPLLRRHFVRRSHIVKSQQVTQKID
jgi:hypothetical protein